MQEKKQAGKKKRLLCLLLAILLMWGMVPEESIQAEESGTLQETEASAEEVTEQGTQSGDEDLEAADTKSDSKNAEETEPDTKKALSEETESNTEKALPEETKSDTEKALSEETEPDTEKALPEETEEPEEPVAYTNSIGGTIWLDANNDGVYDSGETTVAGYEVSLYLAADINSVVETATTNDQGEYLFEGLTPDDYVVGVVPSQTVGDKEYLVPLVGISGDNKFALDQTTRNAYTKTISIAADTVASDYHAGVRQASSFKLKSVGIQDSSMFTVNSTVIGFAGREWWVIGNASSGVKSPQANSLTLWGKNDNFGNGQLTPSYYYVGSPHQTMINALDTNLFTSGNANEKSYVRTRASVDFLTETGANTFGYSALTNQMFWPLSYQEWNTVGNATVRSFSAGAYYYYLRSPYSNPPSFIVGNVWMGQGSGAGAVYASAFTHGAARPAFYLDASKVLFTSDSSGGGMKSAAAGSPALEAATPSGGTVKLTMKDDTNLSLSTTTTLITASPAGGTRTFDYSGAKTGANKSVSVMICNSSGKILYYGRPVNLNGGSSSGTATFTVPSGMAIGDYTMKVFNEEVNAAHYTDYASTPQTFTLRINAATIDLSANPNTTKVYTGTVDITAVVENHTGQPTATIENTEWFRVPVSNTTDYSSSFNSAYAAATSANKGVIVDPNLSELTETFHLEADKNATYWFKGTVKHGATIYTAVKSITVDNLYQQKTVTVRGEIAGSSPLAYLYDYETVTGTYGIPYDLNGTTVLSAPSLGFDTVTLSAKTQYAQNWTSAMKSGTGLPLTLTLNTAFLTNTECDSGDLTKYTIVYTRNANWQNITAYYVDGSDNPLTSVFSQTSEVFPAPLDTSGDVTAFKNSGGRYLPPAVTDYTVAGYKVGSTGTFVALTNFANFDPVIPVASLGITNIYIVYQANSTDLEIDKTVTGTYGDPNKLFEITITLKDSGTPVTDTYDYTGSAIGGVTPPANGSITFDSSGQGTIQLKHGQKITIEDIPQDYTCTVQETDGAVTGGLYTATYSGTGTVSGSGVSAVISEVLGSTTATVSIINDRSTVPLSGLGGANYQLLVVGVLTILAAVVILLWSYRRRKRCI